MSPVADLDTEALYLVQDVKLDFVIGVTDDDGAQ